LSAKHGSHEKFVGRFIIKLLKGADIAVSISKKTDNYQNFQGS